MALPRSRIVSAQVVLRSAEHTPPNKTATITTATLKNFVPSHADVNRSLKLFRSSGFEVGPMVGISFSIGAPVDTFERVFRVRLRESKRGGVEAVIADGSVTLDLPIDALPAAEAELIAAVTFPPAPEFGPGAP